MGAQELAMIQALERRMAANDEERKSLIAKVDENTRLTEGAVKDIAAVKENTQEIVDLFRTTKKVNSGFIALAKWVAATAAGFAGAVAIWHLIKAWWSGGI